MSPKIHSMEYQTIVMTEDKYKENVSEKTPMPHDLSYPSAIGAA